jgi:hypothetical protein
MKYKQTVQITLETQHPTSSVSFCELIKNILGPWCLEAKGVKLNDRGHAYTEAELDPNCVEYVGHIIARECGAPCLCQEVSQGGITIRTRHIDCPWHGR